MDMALLALIALLLGAAVAGGLVSTWSLHRRTRKLEYALNDVEDRLLTVRNREKADKRWQKEQTIEDELALLTVPQKAPARQRRFSNDIMEPEL